MSDHHMDVVEEGDQLGVILKPPGTRGEYAGSRPPGTAASVKNNFRQTWSSIAPSLEILSPEEIREQEMCDLEIEDFDSSGADLTDDEVDDGSGSDADGGHLLALTQGQTREGTQASSLFHVGDPGKVTTEVLQNGTARDHDEDWEKESDISASRQISLIERDCESDVDSEEERDIMKEIKNEITQQVKAEMKDELALMKRRIQKESGANIEKDDDLDNLEPDLKMAILKMRKLDRILAKKEKREKEVKRDRILLQARLKRELVDLKPEGRDDIKEVKVNTSKFLALTLPPSHNLGIRITDRGELEEDTSPPVTPVFTTQVPDDGSKSHKGRQQPDSSRDDDSNDDSASTVTASSAATSSSKRRQKHAKQAKDKSKSKDFIKRNIQLASDAGESVAMTDDEKKRIGDLLADLDTIPDVIEEQSVTGENPYEITLSVDEGFHPSHDEFARLEAIDRRLKALLPKEDFESIASSSPRNLTRQTFQSTHLFTRTNAVIDVDQPGELALQETKEHRDLSQRLKDVEIQLSSLTNSEYNERLDGRLSEQQLETLLDDCARSLSSQRTLETPSEDLSPQSSKASSRQSLLENPPHLPGNVLEQLLAEARETQLQLYPDSAHSDRSDRLSEPPDIYNDDIKTPTALSNHNSNHSVNGTNGSHISSQLGQVIASNTDQQTLLTNALEDVQKHFNDTGSRPTTADTYSTRPSTAETLTNSRPVSGQSLVNSRPPTGQSKELNGTDIFNSDNYRPSSGENKPLFLPAIDLKGSLTSITSTHNVSSSSRPNSRPTSRPKMKNNVWNSVSDMDSLNGSINGHGTSSGATLPHPPSSGGRRNKRTVNRSDSSGYLVEDLE